MANSDKDILITPNVGLSGKPSISLTGVGNSDVNITIDDSANPSLEFSTGNVGSATTELKIKTKEDEVKLFSISDEESVSIAEINSDLATFGSKKGKVIIGSDGIKLPSVNTSSLIATRTGTMAFDGVAKQPKVFTGTTWKVLGSGQDGLSPNTAGSSAEQIKRDYPTSPNGNYWIIYDGVPHHVYCDMDNGGWMYLIPPVQASNTRALNWKWEQKGSQINCESNSLDSTGRYYYLYGYRCGTSSLTTNITWKNYLDVRRVRFSAILNGGNSYQLTLNNYLIDPRRTGGSSYHRYYTTNKDYSYSCTTNMCFNTSQYINSLDPIEHDLYGKNLKIQLYMNSACQPDCNWGVGYIFTKLAVK